MWNVGLTSPWQYPITIMIYLLVIILNAVEIHILRKKRHKKAHETMLLSLSICELQSAVLTTVFMLVKKIVVSYKKLDLSVLWLMVTWGFSSNLVWSSWMLHLIFISFHRLWAIAAPIHHRIHATIKKVKMAIVLSWLIPILLMFTCSSVVIIVENFSVDKSMKFISGPGFQLLTITIFITDIVLITSYLIIAVCLSKSKIPKKRGQENNPNKPQQRNSLYLCAGIVSSFIISSVPIVALGLVQWDPPDWLFQLSNITCPINGAVNSIMYLFQYYYQKRAVSSITCDAVGMNTPDI